MKKKKYNSAITYGIIIIIAIALYSLSSGKTIFSAQLVNYQGSILNQQDFKMYNSIILTQSLFNLEDSNLDYLIMSNVPISEQNDKVVLRTTVSNPFDTIATISQVEIFKNDVSIDRQLLNVPLDDTYIYKSGEIELNGNEAQLNKIKIVFTINCACGKVQETDFEYKYYWLKPCVSDNNCEGENNKCDLGNLAKFTTKANEYFCSKPCQTNTQCYSGQICLQGVCGY